MTVVSAGLAASIALLAGFCSVADARGLQYPPPHRLVQPVPSQSNAELTPEESRQLAEAMKRLTPKQRKRIAAAVERLTPEGRRELVQELKRDLAAKRRASQAMKPAR
jgi:hypothetical protein